MSRKPSPSDARRPTQQRPVLRKTLLVTAVGAALAPCGSWALDLAQSPPGTTAPYIRPNVILSLDDSTSMNVNMYKGGGNSGTAANLLGTRTQVLQQALKDVFNDTLFLPDGKIRLAWQSMNNCASINVGGKTIKGGALLTGAKANLATEVNTMRVFEGTHRQNFSKYMDAFYACGNTPTHDVAKGADDYMRAATNPNGPWSSDPGNTSQPNNEYLGCRRNYHILLTDGGWNGTERQTSPRNYDGTMASWPTNLPTATSAQTEIFRDNENYTTIADWAFYSWAKPLKTTSELTGSIAVSPDYLVAPNTEIFTNLVTGQTATLDKYWNPRYDPATWAHMTTFTIGFSVDALPKNNYTPSGTNKGAIVKPTDTLPYGFDGSFAEYANGTFGWRAKNNDKGHDMWHAAINGRGEFYAVEKGEDLKLAFQKIIGSIQTATDPDLTTTATSGSNSSRNDIGKYIGNYVPKDHWKGFVQGYLVKKDGTDAAIPGWQGKNTADLIDAMNINDRKIITWSDKIVAPGQERGGVPFKWASDETNLSTLQKSLLGSNSNTPIANSGEERLKYIRGDQSKEGTDSPSNYTTTKPFRQRTSRQGDIINSVVWYTGAPSSSYSLKGYSQFSRDQKAREPVIYVGGNDGMLHGFSATDGSEKIAYVPRGIIPTLHSLTTSNYNKSGHMYFVDGSPMTGDVDMASGQNPEAPGYSESNHTPDWHTLLIGTLGAGGKGYFILDVTNPNTFNDTAAIAKNIALVDRTRSTLPNSSVDCTTLATAEKTKCLLTQAEDDDIGHITARPVLDDTNSMRTTQIARMNNNRWAVVLGNGYNSKNQRPVLLVQYLDDMSLKRIPAAGTGSALAQENGLSSPRLVDINGDGRPDVVYAGDNQGNLWKFDITSKDDTDWKVAFNGSPLFTADGPKALNATTRPEIQPISTAPLVRPNDRTKIVGTGTNAKEVNVGGMMVAFGTGRNITKDDPTDTNVQTIYSVLDNTRYRTVGTRVEIHPGGGTCSPIPKADCAPAPKALGKGVVNAGLVERKFGAAVDSTKQGQAIDIAPSDKKIDWSTKNGWFADLPQTGERALKPFEFYDGSNILSTYTQLPARGSSNKGAQGESCDIVDPSEEIQFRTFINIMDGNEPSVQLVDYNGDGLFNAADQRIVRRKVSKGSHNQIITGRDSIADVGAGGGTDRENLARMPEESFRPTWRQLK